MKKTLLKHGYILTSKRVLKPFVGTGYETQYCLYDGQKGYVVKICNGLRELARALRYGDYGEVPPEIAIACPPKTDRQIVNAWLKEWKA